MVTTIVITEADIGEAPPSLQKGADNLLPPTLLIGGGKAPPPHLFFFFFWNKEGSFITLLYSSPILSTSGSDIDYASCQNVARNYNIIQSFSAQLTIKNNMPLSVSLI